MRAPEIEDPDNHELSGIAASRPRGRLPGRRARRHRESAEMAGMVRRVANAMVTRAAAGDLEALAALRQMREHVDQATQQAARELHQPTTWSGGYSWTVIGEYLGISRQAARQQFGRSD